MSSSKVKDVGGVIEKGLGKFVVGILGCTILEAHE
jgi:hypothetical protein